MRSSFIVIVLILICSLSLNVILILKTKKYYGELNLLKTISLNITDHRDNYISSEPSDFAFIGDSRAFQWGQYLKDESYTVRNYALMGITSQQACMTMNCIKENTFGIVVIQVGINDLKTISLYPELEETITDSCLRNISRLIDFFIPRSKCVVITTIFPVPKEPFFRKFLWNKYSSRSIEKVNKVIRLQHAPDLVIFDAYALLADHNGKLISAYKKDFLHINLNGYKHLSNNLITALEQNNLLK
jgi:lysophospholipase L1-like esterase